MRPVVNTQENHHMTALHCHLQVHTGKYFKPRTSRIVGKDVEKEADVEFINGNKTAHRHLSTIKVIACITFEKVCG